MPDQNEQGPAAPAPSQPTTPPETPGAKQPDRILRKALRLREAQGLSMTDAIHVAAGRKLSEIPPAGGLQR